MILNLRPQNLEAEWWLRQITSTALVTGSSHVCSSAENDEVIRRAESDTCHIFRALARGWRVFAGPVAGPGASPVAVAAGLALGLVGLAPGRFCGGSAISAIIELCT